MSENTEFTMVCCNQGSILLERPSKVRMLCDSFRRMLCFTYLLNDASLVSTLSVGCLAQKNEKETDSRVRAFCGVVVVAAVYVVGRSLSSRFARETVDSEALKRSSRLQ